MTTWPSDRSKAVVQGLCGGLLLWIACRRFQSTRQSIPLAAPRKVEPQLHVPTKDDSKAEVEDGLADLAERILESMTGKPSMSQEGKVSRRPKLDTQRYSVLLTPSKVQHLPPHDPFCLLLLELMRLFPPFDAKTSLSRVHVLRDQCVAQCNLYRELLGKIPGCDMRGGGHPISSNDPFQSVEEGKALSRFQHRYFLSFDVPDSLWAALTSLLPDLPGGVQSAVPRKWGKFVHQTLSGQNVTDQVQMLASEKAFRNPFLLYFVLHQLGKEWWSLVRDKKRELCLKNTLEVLGVVLGAPLEDSGPFPPPQTMTQDSPEHDTNRHIGSCRTERTERSPGEERTVTEGSRETANSVLILVAERGEECVFMVPAGYSTVNRLASDIAHTLKTRTLQIEVVSFRLHLTFRRRKVQGYVWCRSDGRVERKGSEKRKPTLPLPISYIPSS